MAAGYGPDRRPNVRRALRQAFIDFPPLIQSFGAITRALIILTPDQTGRLPHPPIDIRPAPMGPNYGA